MLGPSSANEGFSSYSAVDFRCLSGSSTSVAIVQCSFAVSQAVRSTSGRHGGVGLDQPAVPGLEVLYEKP